MSDALPEFEVVNSEGSTVLYDGTTPATIGNDVLLPSTPDKVIESFSLENLAPIDDPFTALLININTELYYSIDDGVTFDTIYAGQAANINPKGNVNSVRIKSNVANAPYRLKVNFEVFSA